MQQPMQAVKRCQSPTKPRGGDIMSQHRDMLANQRIEEKWKCPQATTIVLSDTSHPQCSGRSDVCLSGYMLKAKKTVFLYACKQ